MTRTTAVALAAILAAPLAAVAQPPPGPTPAPAAAAPSQKQTKAFDLELEAATYGGAFDGEGVRRQSGGLAVVEVKAKPQVYGERWFLDVPVRLAHRQTFGTDLVETKGAIALEPWYQATKHLRLGLEAGLSGANRPDWPDLYQRDAVTGALAPTDRYSYLAWNAGAKLYARPAAHQHLRASYRFVSYDYTQDPAFNPDPIDGDVMHLTPRDRVEHHVDTSWRYRQDTWMVGAQLDYLYRKYDTLLARQRGVPVDPAVNPQQELTMWNPALEVGLVRMNGKVELTFGYGLELWDDPYQGYYSLTAHVPKASAAFALSNRLKAQVGIAGWYATYGSGGSHRLDPASATTRKDSKTRLGGELEYTLRGGLALQARLDWITRSTNYQDSITYDIAYDYTNFQALAGIRYKL